MKATDILVGPCPLKDVKEMVEAHHYSHSVAGVKVTQAFRCVYDGKLVGAVVFGQLSTTAWKKYGETEEEVLELRRLVLLDECPRNSESRVIGQCLRWVKKNLPNVVMVVSYADPAYGHSGIIYRASNFKYEGKTAIDHGYTDVESGKTYHSRALRTTYKGEYKPFVRVLRRKLEEGRLVPTQLPGKHIYTYRLREKHSP